MTTHDPLLHTTVVLSERERIALCLSLICHRPWRSHSIAREVALPTRNGMPILVGWVPDIYVEPNQSSKKVEEFKGGRQQALKTLDEARFSLN